jgi:hypothetical protein
MDFWCLTTQDCRVKMSPTVAITSVFLRMRSWTQKYPMQICLESSLGLVSRALLAWWQSGCPERLFYIGNEGYSTKLLPHRV